MKYNILKENGKPVSIDVSPDQIEKMDEEEFFEICSGYMTLLPVDSLRATLKRLKQMKETSEEKLREAARAGIESIPTMLLRIEEYGKGITSGMFDIMHVYFAAYSLVQVSKMYLEDQGETNDDDFRIFAGQIQQACESFIGTSLPEIQ